MKCSEIVIILSTTIMQAIEALSVCKDHYIAYQYISENMSVNFVKALDIDYNELRIRSPDAYNEVNASRDCVVDVECMGVSTYCQDIVIPTHHEEHETIAVDFSTTEYVTPSTLDDAVSTTELVLDNTSRDITTAGPEQYSTSKEEETTTQPEPRHEIYINPTLGPKFGIGGHVTNFEPKIYSEPNGEVFMAYYENCTNKIQFISRKCNKTTMYNKDGKWVIAIECEYINETCSNNTELLMRGAALGKRNDDDNNILVYIIAGLIAVVAVVMLVYFIAKTLEDRLQTGAYRIPNEQNAVFPDFNEDSV